MDNKKAKICQQFLLATLNISQRLLRTVTENKVRQIFPNGLDRRGEHASKNKTSAEQIKVFKDFVESLSAIQQNFIYQYVVAE